MSSRVVVVVDDEPEILYLFEGIIRKKGYEVVTFKSFNEASEYIKSSEPVLIISDLNANGDINGIQFYTNHVMSRSLPFALHTASLEVTETGIRYFQEKMPDEYQIIPDKKSYVSYEKINLIIRDTKDGNDRIFPCFFKPVMPDAILEHFAL